MKKEIVKIELQGRTDYAGRDLYLREGQTDPDVYMEFEGKPYLVSDREKVFRISDEEFTRAIPIKGKGLVKKVLSQFREDEIEAEDKLHADSLETAFDYDPSKED